MYEIKETDRYWVIMKDNKELVKISKTNSREVVEDAIKKGME